MTRWMKVRALTLVPACLAAGALTFAGCGGDDDDGGGGGSDEEYVSALCGGFLDFSEKLDELSGDLGSSSDIEETMKEFGEVFANLADELEDADPPEDVAEANAALITLLRDAEEAASDGDVNALNEIEEPDLELPEETQQRLQTAAENSDECQELEESGFGGDIFGG